MKSYRQGDIFIKPIKDIPETEDKKYKATEGQEIENAIILAHGESTGHKHAIYDGNALLMKGKYSNRFFLLVIKDTKLQHEEHDTITLPIGKYEVIRQRIYSPLGIRSVID